MEKIDARKLPREALEHIRRQAFVLRKQGYTWAHIAEVCGVHVGTVLKWARRAQANSLDTVIKGGQRGRRHGSGRTLTLVQEEQLRLKIIGSNPAQLQLEFALWNRRAVMLAIKQLFGLDMPVQIKYSPDTGPEPVLFYAASGIVSSGCSVMPASNT
jgi:transposase